MLAHLYLQQINSKTVSDELMHFSNTVFQQKWSCGRVVIEQAPVNMKYTLPVHGQITYTQYKSLENSSSFKGIYNFCLDRETNFHWTSWNFPCSVRTIFLYRSRKIPTPSMEFSKGFHSTRWEYFLSRARWH
jgi:hypothetical protein